MNTAEIERKAAWARINSAKREARERLHGAHVVPVEQYESLRDASAEPTK